MTDAATVLVELSGGCVSYPGLALSLMLHSEARLPLPTPLRTCSLMLATGTRGCDVVGLAVVGGAVGAVDDFGWVVVVVDPLVVDPCLSTRMPTITTTMMTRT